MDKKKFNKAEYDKEWRKANTKRISIKFRNDSDQLIISKLNSVESKSAYIKSLILKDLEENKQN